MKQEQEQIMLVDHEKQIAELKEKVKSGNKRTRELTKALKRVSDERDANLATIRRISHEFPRMNYDNWYLMRMIANIEDFLLVRVDELEEDVLRITDGPHDDELDKIRQELRELKDKFDFGRLDRVEAIKEGIEKAHQQEEAIVRPEGLRRSLRGKEVRTFYSGDKR